MDQNQKDRVIREVVEELVAQDSLFTSVDVGNAVKRKILSMDIRNREVAQWLRDNAAGDVSMQDYDSVVISVENGRFQATLYYPHWCDPEDYVARDQKALGPDDIADLRKQVGKPPLKSDDHDSSVDSSDDSGKDITKIAGTVDTATSTNVASGDGRYDDSKLDIADLFDDGDQYNPDGSGVRIKKKLASIDRIWIPKDIVKGMGFNPGDVVDISKVKIHHGSLNSGLKVHYDGRFAIPRRCVGYGTDPIKVILKGDEVFFEKA